MGNCCILADFYPSPFPMPKDTHTRGCRTYSHSWVSYFFANTHTITSTMTDTITNTITDTLTSTMQEVERSRQEHHFGWVQGGYVRSEVNITCALMPLD